MIENIFEPAKKIPIIYEADVLVVGAGTSGLAAALGAAREGADILLLERYGYVGGASTGGLVITLPTERQGVITHEIEERLLEIGGAAIMEHNDWLSWCPETLKWVGVKMLEEAQVKMLFHTWCVGCTIKDRSIDGVIIESKSGRQAIKAKVIVDCTGDADVANFSSAPCIKGDAKGKMQPVTLMAVMSDANEEQIKQSEFSQKALLDLDNSKLKLGKFDKRAPQHICRSTNIYPGHHSVWGGWLHGIDGTNPWDLTKAENELRKQIFEWALWSKKNVPGYENAYISMTAHQIGVRETRSIVGEYMLSHADWNTKTTFHDHIGFAFVGKSIPYRALLPQKVDNLLVAGRCIAHDRTIMDSIRVIPACMVTGYAAGIAAALAVQNDTLPRNLETTKLQEVLKGNGVLFP